MDSIENIIREFHEKEPNLGDYIYYWLHTHKDKITTRQLIDMMMYDHHGDNEKEFAKALSKVENIIIRIKNNNSESITRVEDKLTLLDPDPQLLLEEESHTLACFYLALLHHERYKHNLQHYKRKDVIEQFFKHAAAHNHLIAKYILNFETIEKSIETSNENSSIIYKYAINLDHHDESKMIHLLEKSGLLGHVLAMERLGSFYRNKDIEQQSDLKRRQHLEIILQYIVFYPFTNNRKQKHNTTPQNISEHIFIPIQDNQFNSFHIFGNKLPWKRMIAMSD